MKIVWMWNCCIDYEVCVGYGFEFDWCVGCVEYDQFVLFDWVWCVQVVVYYGGLVDLVVLWWLVGLVFICF